MAKGRRNTKALPSGRRKTSIKQEHPSSSASSLSISRTVRPSRSSIHSEWKRDLGGLIRWYINSRPEASEDDVDRLYAAHGCSAEATRDSLLRLLDGSVPQDDDDSTPKNKWISVSMVVEQEHVDESSTAQPSHNKGEKMRLQVEERPGEGPAFSTDTWNVVVVPPEAVGKSYYLEVVNDSPLDLSCEMSIDGHKVAKNAPIPAKQTRTVKPDNTRYFQSHKWLLQPAQRIDLKESSSQQQQQQPSSGRSPQASTQLHPIAKPGSSQRENGILPNYQGNRLSFEQYPDPTLFGWNFTGSVEESRVEFFEKKLNIGTVLMDFYYTTGIVKTVLDHPTTGTNQLFRRCITSPDIYKQLLQNPRFHTNIGYRQTTQNQQGHPTVDDPIMVDLAAQPVPDIAMSTTAQASYQNETETEMQDDSQVFFAKNEEYNFQEAGHENRKAAMAELQPMRAFKAWEEAAKKEWAFVHVKFFVSVAKRKSRAINATTSHRKRGPHQTEELPAMAPVVDVKAAEKAVLTTKFEATGPPTRPKSSSNVLMKRIPGLNDDPEWRTKPVFEYKLYYRAQDALDNDSGSVVGDGMDDDDDDDDSDGMNDEEETVPLAEKLQNEIPLDDRHKVEKRAQLDKWFMEHKASNIEAAEFMYASCRRGIESAQDSRSLDECMQVYWNWHQKQEWPHETIGLL
eukprot:scaffold50278_cov52-Attheya_sp.AAC.1